MNIIFLPLLFLFSSTGLADFGPTLIGGRNAIEGEFPEVIYIRAGTSRCSATIVGPRVVLTAAHCVADNGEIEPVEFQLRQAIFSARCRQHPGYKNDSALDFALCQTDRDMDASPASIASDGPKKGDLVTLSGYGCTQPGGGGGNNGQLKVGKAPVTQEARIDGWFHTKGSDALCFGDSGGPAFLYMAEPMGKHHYVQGVNSRGNIKDLSLLSSLELPKAREFLRNFANESNLEICGLNKDCGGGQPDPDPQPEPEPEPKPEPWKCRYYRKKIEKYQGKLDKYQRKYDRCMADASYEEILNLPYIEE